MSGTIGNIAASSASSRNASLIRLPGQSRKAHKANETAPWKHKCANSSQEELESTLVAKSRNSPTFSAHKVVQSFSDWSYVRNSDPGCSMTRTNQSESTPSRTNSDHSFMTSPSPQLHRESYSSGSDRNSVKSPRCRKLKSPFSGGTVLPSKPCLKRAPPSTQDIAQRFTYSQISTPAHKTETLTKTSLQFQNYLQSISYHKATNKSVGRSSPVFVSRSFSSPSPESSSSDSGFFK